MQAIRASFMFRLLFVFTVGVPALALAQSPGTFSATGTMIAPRSYHTATLLPDGKVLIAGGLGPINAPYSYPSPVSSAELYDPSTGTFSATGPMTTPRTYHTATLLPSGKVLIAGGLTYDGVDSSGNLSTHWLTSAELYEPSTGTFTPTGNMAYFQSIATLLNNGKVLMTGSSQYPTVPAELYDPAAGTFAFAGPFSSTALQSVGLATPLADGRVLVSGDWKFASSGHSELFDPVAGTFVTTGSVTEYDAAFTATLLINGKVLLVGNQENDLIGPAYAEAYDPKTGAFTNAGAARNPHFGSSATMLSDGTILLAGSQLDCALSDARAELYDSATGTFAVTGGMITSRFSHTATLLPDGTVLVAGGETKQSSGCPTPGATPVSSAEIYHPSVLAPAPALFSLSGDGRGQGAIWHAATGQAASAGNPAIAGEALSMYTTSLVDGGVVPPQVAIGGTLARVLYFGASGYPGYNQVNFLVPGGIAAGPAVPVRLTYLSRPSNAVTIGVQ